MLTMGAVRLAGLPLDLTQPSPDGRPIACPRTGVVVGATSEHLISDLCDVAVVKDIRRGTLNEISTFFHCFRCYQYLYSSYIFSSWNTLFITLSLKSYIYISLLKIFLLLLIFFFDYTVYEC